MTSNAELLARRGAAVSNSVVSATPVFTAKAQNAEIWDEDGNRYVDFAAGIAVCNTGHCHPRIIEAVKAQCDKFTHMAFQVTAYEGYIRLAERLNEMAPIENAKSIFFTTGAEAVENAVRVARVHTGRQGVIAFRGGFHGRTALTSALTGKILPYRAGSGLGVPGIFHLPFPMPHHGITSEDSLEALQHLFKADIEARDVAAIIIEPVQGEGGFYIAPPEFMAALRDICDEHGILLIADEIQTGFARTGKMFAIEHSDVEPDLMTVAKAIAGGFPISGLVGRRELMDGPGPGGMGGTYAGSPIACAAAHAALDIITEENLCDKSARIGERLIERITAIKSRNDTAPIGDVRGLGSMVAFELVKERGGHEPDPEAAAAVIVAARERGLIILSCGYFGNTVRVLAPLTIPKEHLEEGLDILEESLIAIAA